MKRTALLSIFLFGILVIFSCKKEEKITGRTLIGKWELKSTGK